MAAAAAASEGFSSSLRVAQDFLIPSAVCINPPQATEAEVLQHSGVSETLSPAFQVPLKITLQDCLACNGCVTTAEAVLVEAQSVDELRRAFTAANDDVDSSRVWYVSISEQSAVSLAAYWSVSVVDAYERIAGFMKRRIQCEVAPNAGSDGPDVIVTDLCWATEYAVHKVCEEYDQRKKMQQLPLITSSCPGLCCYWEKQGGDLLSLLSNVMSPQGIAGSYVKRTLAARNPLCQAVYHVSIQPCFDRKLEAARDGFMATSPYTDCVLSTLELLQWMNECDAAAAASPSSTESSYVRLEPSTLNSSSYKMRKSCTISAEQARLRGSGGYHQQLLFHLEHPTLRVSIASVVTWAEDGGLVYAKQRNTNHQIVHRRADPSPTGTFHVAYGFQHIQNIVRQLRTVQQKKSTNSGKRAGKESLQQRLALLQRKKANTVDASSAIKWSECQFVELMACPHGCLNGGGQARVPGETSSVDYLFSKAGEAVGSLERECPPPPPEQDELTTDLHWSFDGLCNAESQSWANSCDSPSAARRGDLLWYCEFKDRRAEFEKVLNEGGVHVLQW